MESYIYDRNRDGVFYLDLAKTWEKTMVAARIIAAIQEKSKKDVLVSVLSLVPHGAIVAVFVAFANRVYFRSFPPAPMPREPCSSSPLTPAPTTWAASGSQEL